MSTRLRIAVPACLSVALLLSGRTQVGESSKGQAVPPKAKEVANKILESAASRFLSGPAINELNLISGRVPVPGRGHKGGPAKSLPFTSSRFQVLVNDPSLDLFSDFDITTQSETNVAGFGNTVVVAYNNDREIFFASNSGEGYSRSTNGGATFTDLGLLPAPSEGFNFGDPALVADRAGNFYVAAIDLDFTRPPEFQETVGISKSTDEGATFSVPVSPSPGGMGVFHFFDKEFLAVDNSGGLNTGNVYETNTDFQFDDTTFAFLGAPIVFSRSTDGGATFSPPIQVSAPDDFVTQGSQPAVGPNGEIYVAWFSFSPLLSGDGSLIHVAKSTDGGISFGTPVVVATIKPIGFLGGQTSLMGNFRVNSFPRIDVDPRNGNVYIIYAANPAIPGRSDTGDVFFARSTDEGATWSSPLRVNDDPGTNDQFFPVLAVNGQGIIEAIWYDRRLDPRDLKLDVYKAQSTDGGLSFGPNHRVTLESFLPAVGYDPLLNPVYMGDYIDIKTDVRSDGRGSRFLMAWSDNRRIIITPQGTRPDQDVFFGFDR